MGGGRGTGKKGGGSASQDGRDFAEMKKGKRGKWNHWCTNDR